MEKFLRNYPYQIGEAASLALAAVLYLTIGIGNRTAAQATVERNFSQGQDKLNDLTRKEKELATMPDEAALTLEQERMDKVIPPNDWQYEFRDRVEALRDEGLLKYPIDKTAKIGYVQATDVTLGSGPPGSASAAASGPSEAQKSGCKRLDIAVRLGVRWDDLSAVWEKLHYFDPKANETRLTVIRGVEIRRREEPEIRPYSEISFIASIFFYPTPVGEEPAPPGQDAGKTGGR